MNNFERYLLSKSELLLHKNEKYVKLDVVLQYTCLDTVNINVDIFYLNDQIYVDTSTAENIIKTKYNKNNSKVIQWHKEMGFDNLEYTTSAKLLSPITTSLNKVEAQFETLGNMIETKTNSMYKLFDFK